MAEYIERDMVIRALTLNDCDSARAKASILDIPAADVAPVVHGLWIGEGDGYAETEEGEMVIVYDVWGCSECSYTIDDGTDDLNFLPRYCPNCGAKMDKEVDNG